MSAMPKAKITVLTSSKIGIKAIYLGEVYDTLLIEQRPKKAVVSSPKEKTKKRTYSKPAPEHPWRQQSKKMPLLYEETDTEILKMLEEIFSSIRAWA